MEPREVTWRDKEWARWLKLYSPRKWAREIAFYREEVRLDTLIEVAREVAAKTANAASVDAILDMDGGAPRRQVRAIMECRREA